MPMEETEAYKAGMRDARVQNVENSLKVHEERCDKRSADMWAELKSHTKLIYAGFGILMVLEIIILGLAAFFSGSGSSLMG